MEKEIHIHIGTHKTGSTSLQSILGSSRIELRRQGKDYYFGSINENNHIELYLVTLRKRVETFGRLSANPRHNVTYGVVKADVQQFINESSCDRLIFSCEGLSLLRTPSEVRALKLLFGDQHKFKILLALRNKIDFLASYRAQILKKPGRMPSSDPDSALYVESDTWLLKYEELEKVYRDEFGDVEVVNYSRSVVRELLIAMGVNLPEEETRVFLNSRN
ncbi:hypothetical protein RDV64_04900 [Acuticoccus sp. MNP-M23]|uniref:hypothetical protein n=1 Tax=Acuticoccus sp. MNP-M23 TaxID=3072793 RepID=UPI0028153FEF|nr:hypothetical protein [Acuticoccus sp. MNP-M23]WMS43741.1 hypothetical protein RDV64_04900 [Acuticoccus sp. MNP-M23]